MTAYLDDPFPTAALLVNALPGVGKTTAGVEAAEQLAARRRRVMYAGPRHDFFADVLKIATRPEDWYEWLPRQTGDDQGKVQTCRFVDQISGWLAKGYDGMAFCSGVCGWDYVGRCPWHRQKERGEPIIFAQHQHLASGHPLDFSVAIVDENPMSAFLHRWNIPAKGVKPRGVDYTDDLYPILLKLTGLCAGELIEGEPLLEALGGPQDVLEACAPFRAWDETAKADIDIHSAFEADSVDYYHLPRLAKLLYREADVARKGVPYAHRVIAGKGDLTLLLRKTVSPKLPPHVICLDATGNAHIYETVLQRPVKVVNAAPRLAGRITVVTDRANGKGDFRADDVKLLARQIVRRQAYNRPALITYQGAKAELGEFDTAHFYGARGTNRLEQCDGLIVAGTPMPALSVLRTTAAMLFFDRMLPFDVKAWTSRWLPYAYVDPADGQGREYPAGGYWGDADLQAVTWQYREAELIQAVHRARPIHREVDVWLLSNLPIAELPVAALTTAAEILGVVPPEGLSLYAWARFLDWAETRDSVSASNIRAELKVSEPTAIKYRDLLAQVPGWELAAVKVKSGRSEKKVSRTPVPLKRH